MSVINRRNAVLGWAVWSVAKRAGKKKARAAAPAVEDGRPNRSLVAVAVAAAAGAAGFVLSRRSSEDES